MSLTVESTEVHIHRESNPLFAIKSAQHPDGAWVIAKKKSNGEWDTALQQAFFAKALEAHDSPSTKSLRIVCGRYEDSGNDRRFYFDVESVEVQINVHPSGLAAIIRSLPSLTTVIRRGE